MINEVRERFIKSIAEKIPADRIVEAFFFPAIRQGPVETGVAVIAATPVLAQPEAVSAAPEGDAPPESGMESSETRAEVFSASYRWTRKGIERGKWEVEVTTEAHAPLVTVATVVRGVQERAGEALDAQRMSGEEIRAALPAASPADADSTASAA